MATQQGSPGVNPTISTGFGNKPSGKKTTYWKKNSERVPGSIKPVYSARYPPSEIANQAPSTHKSKSKRGDSFADFDSSTSDVWEINDDELLAMSSAQQRELERRSSGEFDESRGGTAAEARNVSYSEQGSVKDSSLLSTQGLPNRTQDGVEAPRPTTPIRSAATSFPPQQREVGKLGKFSEVLSHPNTDLDQLRKLSWSGIPQQVRAMAWKLLLGYLPANTDRREPTLERKRSEYVGFVDQYYDTRHDPQHQDMFRQIHIDIPRTNPLIPLFQQPVVQEIFERILYIWAVRHPASGYVQGINDLVTPFFVVFLSEQVGDNVDVTEDFDVSTLPKESIRVMEADTFWCMSKLLDGIQDNYTFAQPGIQLKVNQLKELIQRIDKTLANHLVSHQVEYLQFAFRWMNNLLMRELPLKGTIRLWDTYMSEPEGFAIFHLYVCAAFLQKFSSEVKRERDFQGIMLFLQNLPTAHWSNDDISLLLAEAYRLKYMFADAPRHFNQQVKR
ncbi:TBC1 domain family member 22B-like [Amphiura filiformis]|uniref:TBC1 domain family member 22B-like n=1 Tax=Amphiura filiformis TaxID=82378 RepID=UPI003B21D37F